MTLIKNLFLASLAGLLVAGTPMACSDGGTDPTVVTDVFINGAVRTTGVGGTLQFEGRASNANGTRVDELVSWTVSAPAVISVTGELVTVGGNLVNRATVKGLAPGSSDLIATAGSVKYTIRITVSSSLPG